MMKSNHILSRAARIATLCALAAVFAGGLAACRGERSDDPPRQFLPDMDDSPKFRPQAQTDFFEDGRSMRKPVVGTVAFGYSMDPLAAGRGWSLKEDPAVFQGLDPASPADETGRPAYQPVMPGGVVERIIADAAADGLELTADEAIGRMVARGEERFNIYCAVCHGYAGEGSNPGVSGGPVGLRWSGPVPTFHDAKYKDRAVYTGQDGYIFHVIRNGVPHDAGGPPKMPSYADKISVPDAWGVVLYLRALQGTRTEGTDGLPDDVRRRLEQSRPDASRSSVDAPAAPALAATETNR